jgi:hypothetical protein
VHRASGLALDTASSAIATMKILEAQSAVLTNFEVYEFLNNQSRQYQEQEKKRRGPGNLETLRREVSCRLFNPI